MKDIDCYLPYGLKVQHETVDCGEEIIRICNVELMSLDYLIFDNEYDYYFYDGEYDNPIINLSLALYKTTINSRNNR